MKKVSIPGLRLFIIIGLALLVFIMIYEGVTGAKTPAAEVSETELQTDAVTVPETTPTMPVFRTDRDRAEYYIKMFADEHGIHYTSYPEVVVELLTKNPETEEFVKDYPLEYGKTYPVDMKEYKDVQGVPLFFQWDKRWGYTVYGGDVVGITGGGPICLSMAAYYLTGDDAMSPDNIIRFAIENEYYILGGGSSWALIGEGAEQLGLESTELPLSASAVTEQLQNGGLVICAMEAGVFTDTGHYILITGQQNGQFTIHDPNSRENSEKLWDFSEFSAEIENLWVIRKAQ